MVESSAPAVDGAEVRTSKRNLPIGVEVLEALDMGTAPVLVE